MHIKFIGYGGAFDYKQVNSAAIIKIGSISILIDCGHSVYPILKKLNIAEEIDYVFITHLHDDHVGSLSTFLIDRNFFSTPPKLIFPDFAFKNTLVAFLKFSMQNPENYFEFMNIKDIGFANYIDTKNYHVKGMQTFSYIFYEKGEYVVYSGDLNNPGYLVQKLEEKGIKKGLIFHDISFNKINKAHAYYKEVEKIPAGYNVTGYHYNAEEVPSDCKVELVGEREEFLFTENLITVK